MSTDPREMGYEDDR